MTVCVDLYDLFTLAAYSLVAVAILRAWRQSRLSAHERALKAANDE